MADDRNLQFAERAYKNYKEEIEDLTKVVVLLNKGKEGSEIEEYREPLSYDERKEITVLLSWGGPSDGYKVHFDKEGNPLWACYFFADWFEYKEFQLSEDEFNLVLAVYFQHVLS